MARAKTLRSDIADALGITPTVVSKYWKRGMPRDSVTDAVRWHTCNTKKNTRAENRPPKVSSAKRGEDLAQIKVAPEASEGRDNLESTMSKLQEEARYLAAMMKKSQGDLDSSKYYRGELILAAEQIRKIEVVWQKIQKEKSESISVEDAREGIGQCVSKLLTFLDRLPMRATKKMTGAARAESIAGLKAEIIKAKNELFDFKAIL